MQLFSNSHSDDNLEELLVSLRVLMHDKGIDPNDRMRSAFEYRMTCERFYHMEAKHWHHVEYQGPMLRKSEFSEWLDNTVGERNYLRYLPKGEPEVLVFRNKSDAVYCKLRWNIG